MSIDVHVTSRLKKPQGETKMGMGPFRNCSLRPTERSYGGSPQEVVVRVIHERQQDKIPPMPNPNPARFKIKRTCTIGECLIVHANYPDCINYEGDKIMLYLNMTLKQLDNRRTLDPHFAHDGSGPIARFAPTPYGWKLATVLAKQIAAHK